MKSDERANVTPLSPPGYGEIAKSAKLADVCYEIRGPALAEAARMEEEGHRIVRLNIGNPAPFGFEAPEEILVDVIHNLPTSQGYCESKGIYSARKAVMQYCQQIGIANVDVEDIYIGNGASELIVMAMQGLLNNGDEILVPAPDYPLWTAAITLSGGKAVHYRCDEGAEWLPDVADIKRCQIAMGEYFTTRKAELLDKIRNEKPDLKKDAASVEAVKQSLNDFKSTWK